MPYPYLITSGVETDFEATMSLIKRLSEILQSGLKPVFASLPEDGISKVGGSFLRSKFKPYLRHYHNVSGTYDVTSIFRKDTEGFENPYTIENLKNVFSYGNVFEFFFDNIKVDELHDRMRDLDSLGNQFFSSFATRKVYEMYFGKQALIADSSTLTFLHPILTAYFAVLIAEDTQEFKNSARILQERGCELKVVIEDAMAIGSNEATNYIHTPFFDININPILINLEKKGYYKLQDAFGSIFYMMVAIGELYNILSILTDIHELCAMTLFSIPAELYEKVGVLKINPVKDVVGIYGLRDFRKCDRTFRLGLIEDINYMRAYGSKASSIIWKKEAFPHFSGITEVLGLIDSYMIHLPEKTLFENERKKTDFVKKLNKQFQCDFKDFLDTLEEWVNDVSQVIESARTTVQLNLAIIALFWTLVCTIFLSDDVRTLFSHLISYLMNL
jgi:hypothetical protein